MLPSYPVYSQNTILNNFGYDLYYGSKPIACYTVTFSPESGGDRPAYGYFSCDESGDKCRECYNEAVNEMKGECLGKAGATVSLEHCCLSALLLAGSS
ncbi:hypothetical protein LINPERPRIM_LOCUS39723 [Linum perenne]